MSLIPVDQLSILRPAVELAAVAKTAKEDQQLMKIAYLLNTAANTGETSIRFSGELMIDSVKSKLEEENYKVLFLPNAGGFHYIISVETAAEGK